jgi:hypothetical protein
MLKVQILACTSDTLWSASDTNLSLKASVRVRSVRAGAPDPHTEMEKHGVPLEPGLQFDGTGDVPEASRPDGPEADLSQPTSRGRHHRARVGRDGTRWCAGCLTTLDAATKLELCDRCKTKANTLRRAHVRARAAGEPVELPRAVVNDLVSGMRRLFFHVGEVNAALEAGDSTEDAGIRLAKQSASVALLLRKQVEPLAKTPRRG